MTEHDPGPSQHTPRRSRQGLAETSRAVVPCSSLSTVTPGQHLRRRSCVSGCGNPGQRGAAWALDDGGQEWTRDSLVPEVSMGLSVSSPRTPLNSGITSTEGRAKANISRAGGHLAMPALVTPGRTPSSTRRARLRRRAFPWRGYAGSRCGGLVNLLTLAHGRTPPATRSPAEGVPSRTRSQCEGLPRLATRPVLRCVSRCFAPVSLGYQRIPLQAV